jgi:hypothetical protein
MTDEDLEPSDDVIFYEEQRPWWGFVAVGYFVAYLAGAFVLYAILQRFIFHKPLVAESLAAEMFFLALAALVMAVGGVVATARLIIEVRPGGLYVRFVPIHLRLEKIELDQVTNFGPGKFWPLLDFPRWGIHLMGPSKSYTVRGNRYVYINYVGGKSVLLGTQRPEELTEAIRGLRQDA